MSQPTPQPTSQPATGADCGCPEFSGLSRRGLLRGALGAGALMSTTAAFGTAFVETSYAATRSAPAVLVVLSMRGAVDGMSLVVPHGDPVYYAARPQIVRFLTYDKVRDLLERLRAGAKVQTFLPKSPELPGAPQEPASAPPKDVQDKANAEADAPPPADPAKPAPATPAPPKKK